MQDGFHIFEGVSRAGLVCLFVAYFATYLIKGVVGLGALTPAILFGSFIVGPRHSVLLALTANALSQVQFIPQAIRDGQWKIARKVIGANFAGAAVGIWVFGRLDEGWMTLVLGATLGLLSLIDQSDRASQLMGRIKLDSSFVILSLSGAAGFISGVAGAGGLTFLAIYLRHLCPDPRTLRGTILLLGMLFVGWRALVFATTGFIDAQVLAEAALLLPFAVLGGWLGTRLYRFLPATHFYAFFKGVVLLSAVGLIYKGLRAVISE